jgi:hypothetical protein
MKAQFFAPTSSAGFEMVKPHLRREAVDGKTYWWVPPRATRMVKAPIVHLLPNYDEYLIAYKDHSSSTHPLLKNLERSDDALRAHIIVLNGQVVGGWRRTIKKDEVAIKTDLQTRLNKSELADLRVAAERYGRFIGRTVTLT